jgi:hypothetical protein
MGFSRAKSFDALDFVLELTQHDVGEQVSELGTFGFIEV